MWNEIKKYLNNEKKDQFNLISNLDLKEIDWFFYFIKNCNEIIIEFLPNKECGFAYLMIESKYVEIPEIKDCTEIKNIIMNNNSREYGKTAEWINAQYRIQVSSKSNNNLLISVRALNSDEQINLNQNGLNLLERIKIQEIFNKEFKNKKEVKSIKNKV